LRESGSMLYKIDRRSNYSSMKQRKSMHFCSPNRSLPARQWRPHVGSAVQENISIASFRGNRGKWLSKQDMQTAVPGKARASCIYIPTHLVLKGPTTTKRRASKLAWICDQLQMTHRQRLGDEVCAWVVHLVEGVCTSKTPRRLFEIYHF
jgi:hypothetical protein